MTRVFFFVRGFFGGGHCAKKKPGHFFFKKKQTSRVFEKKTWSVPFFFFFSPRETSGVFFLPKAKKKDKQQKFLKKMTSRKTVCTLDGGGMKAYFQITLMRIIRTSFGKLPLDLVVGVSAGAIVGAILALDMLDDEKMDATHFQTLTKNLFRQKGATSLLTKPKYDGVAKRDALLSFFGQRRFGDVRIPLCVVCSTMDGGVMNFCSWKPEHSQLLLADVLNATSAAPLYFPPVHLNGVWLTDGGIRANKPLIQGVLFAWELFGKFADLNMLSIGTYFLSKYRFDSKRATHMGLIAWVKQGIVNVLMGTQDITQEQFCTQLFGDQFLRLVCMCDDVSLDDHGPQVQDLLTQAAENTFTNNRAKIAKLFGF